MPFLVFQDGELKKEYTPEEFDEMIVAKATLRSYPGEWAYWVESKLWFTANQDQNGYLYVASLNQVPKEYRAIALLYQ